ncbi:hypothetical protein F5884DRAFT_809485 [Xylogone sp. PMI_703]|nr:hypothetical protein F5884DRAFT_809485 [Xylogone sp. PMI_703]
MVVPDSGVMSGSFISGSPAAIATVAFLSVAFYNVIELNLIILATFKKRGGLYFWSFVIATWGIAPHSVGILIKNLSLCTIPGIYVTLMAVGWSAMVTGQSLVLYSRLHLVLNNRTGLRFVLGMIIFDAIICYPPAIFLAYAIHSSHSLPYLKAYAIQERIQITIFFIQEFIISGLYIWETAKLKRLENSVRVNGTAHRIMMHLLIVNVIVILLDVTILALEYAGLYNIQTAWKPFMYSVKLKLEFSILNKLVELANEPTDLTVMVTGPGTGRSLIDTDGVALETSNDDRRNRLSKNLARGVGYNAYIHNGDGPGDVPYGEFGQVIKTTEVHVYNDGLRRNGERRRSPGRIDVKSGVTLAGASVLRGSPSSFKEDLVRPCF